MNLSIYHSITTIHLNIHPSIIKFKRNNDVPRENEEEYEGENEEEEGESGLITKVLEARLLFKKKL